MYGGGEFDGNVAFTGGGFMPSQATTQAHDSSSSFKQHGESENKKTYGGGEFYGNSVFAGGGFMPSQATNQAHDSSSSFKNRTLLPLTLKQLNSVSTNSESDFSIDGVDVAITGRVSIVENRTTRVNFVVEDGTGSVECVRWCQEHQEAEEMEAVKLGMYVHLLGHLKSLQGKRFVNVFSIRPVTDLNEIANPLVASSSINMEESSDVENKIDSAESKLAEEIRKSSEQEMRLKEVGRPERIRELIAMGASFDPGEAGHLHCKIVHVADITGREIQKALLEAPLNHPNEIYSAESKLAEEIRKNSELETRLKELETRLQQERLLFAKERESQEAILHKQREYLDALEKELGAKEESMLRSRKSRAMDGMMFDDVTIPDRSTALKNLPLKFHGAYNKLTVNKVKTYLEPWVWEEAKSSNKTGNFYLSDDFIFAHLCWQIQEPVVSHRKQLRKLAGHVRDQHGHRICWGYVGSDLVAIKRVIRGWKKEYVPLCPWFLSHFVPSDDPTFRRGHKCRNTSLKDCLEYIQREGVPEEIPGHEVFDCTKRPPSSDQPKFKIKSVVNIETFEEAFGGA